VAPEPTVAGPLRIGRYEVISHLATGGMAQIYLARQTGLGSFERHVVLKTILRERATDQRFVTMFLDEAKLAATLNHQNVAQVYEVDQADGAYFMAMEYVHGENTRAILETTIRRGWTIPLELAVMIISGAAAGLHHAHERRGKNGQPLNIVHRDVSPANIMVGYDGSVKVLDFGIAKADERATKTIGGTIKGKYGYMSPEQCKGKPIDRRSDIFALGIVLYELTTLRRAFKGNDDFETMKRIVAGDVVLPTTVVPGFPRELEAIILTALANDPAARFQSGQELIEALDAFTVRAKLTGSNTAMGRFMTQLFGTKKEPWLETAVPGDAPDPGEPGDHTVVTPSELDDYEDENDETLVLSSRQDVQRALDDLNLSTPRAPGAPPHAGTETAGRPVAEPSKRPTLRRAIERPSLPFATPSPPAAAPAHPSAPPVSGPSFAAAPPAAPPPPAQMMPPPVQMMPPPAQMMPPAQKAPPGSHKTPPPQMTPAPHKTPPPQVTPAPHKTPPLLHKTPPPQMMAHAVPSHTNARAHPMSGPHPMAPPSSPTARIDLSRQSNPNLAATIIGPVPVVSSHPPLTNSGLPPLVASDEISQIGAKPLVTDPKLGWETSVRLTAPNDGGHTRLARDPIDVTDYRIRSNAFWVAIGALLVIVVAVLIVIAVVT
jgi:eukaryotic-like serine/threonine-protein kinase